MPPGWYPALGDAPGTQRYWDGQQWQGNPHPIPGAAPIGFGPPSAQYPESSNALAALICSIGGFVLCGVLFPVGWWLGSKELGGIKAGRRDPANKSLAQAGRIIGMIGTILMILAIVSIVGLVITGVALELD